MNLDINININLVFETATFLNEAIKKSYQKGIKSIITKNKKSILKFDDRKLFEVDYSAQDILALQNFRVEAFYTSYIGHYRLQEKLKSLGIDYIKSGQDFSKFEEEARKLLNEYIPFPEQPPSGWLETNLNTAVGSSYHASQYIRLQDREMKRLYPAYKYMTRNDSRVRAEHFALHGKIFQAEDSIWSRIYPPNGWNCRCYVIPLSTNEFGSDEVEPVFRSEDATKSILKNAGLSKEFDRNSGETKSIWSKWITSELKNINFPEIKKRMIEFTTINKISSKESDFKIPDMESNKKIITTDFDNNKILIPDTHDNKQVENLLNNCNEVWGENKVVENIITSRLFYITYSSHKAILTIVKNGEFELAKEISFDDLVKYRRGVLIHFNN